MRNEGEMKAKWRRNGGKKLLCKCGVVMAARGVTRRGVTSAGHVTHHPILPSSQLSSCLPPFHPLRLAQSIDRHRHAHFSTGQ